MTRAVVTHQLIFKNASGIIFTILAFLVGKQVCVYSEPVYLPKVMNRATRDACVVCSLNRNSGRTPRECIGEIL